MIRHVQKKKIPFGWIGMDSSYGRDSWLRNRINDRGLLYIADIPCNLRVWLQKPQVGILEQKKGCGRPPTRKQVLDDDSVRVDELKEQLSDDAWKQVFIRDTERRELWMNMFCLRVYPREDNGLPGEQCWLIIREDPESDEVKYQYPNALKEASID